MEKTVSNSTAMAQGKVVSISTARSVGNNSGAGQRPAVSASLADNESGRAPEAKSLDKTPQAEKVNNEVKPISETAPNPNIEEKELKVESDKPSKIASFADHLVEKAKEEGVDAAFEELASDESSYEDKETDSADEVNFEGKPKGDENQEDINPKESNSKETIEPEITDLENEEEIDDDPAIEQDPISVQVEFLQARVESLAAENREFKIKLDSVTEANKQALMTAYEVAMLLKKMIEEEENEKKKKSLYEMLVNILTKILVLIMVGEEEAEKIGREDQGEQPQVEKMAA